MSKYLMNVTRRLRDNRRKIGLEERNISFINIVINLLIQTTTTKIYKTKENVYETDNKIHNCK